MNNFMKKTCFFIVLILFINISTVYGFSSTEPNFYEGFLVLDTDRDAPLPKRFRDIPSLNISGSAEFVPSQVMDIKKAINKPNIFIVDLRQESHGFLNDIAVSYYSPDRLLNNGFSSEDTLADEIEKFGNIKLKSTENIYNKRGALLQTITVSNSQIEEKLVQSSGMNYALFATRDGHIPSPAVTDSFVNFVKITPETTHLHFHCDHGEGRTTLFMAMFQMMKESNVKSLEEILKEQLDAGGIILTYDTTRAEFLKDFYNYTKENSKNNFETPFSVWSVKSSQSKY